MRSHELDRRIAAASPVRDADVAVLDLEAAATELLEEILDAPYSVRDAVDAYAPKPRSNRRVGLRVVAVAAVAAAAIFALTLLGNGDIGGDQHPEFAAAAIKVAKANPRLLVTEPGWSVTRADEFTADQGEMTFSDGKDELELFWTPADQYRAYLGDRTADSSARAPVEVLGRQAMMFRYDDTSSGSPDFTTIIPPQGKTFIEVRGDALGSEDAYMGLLQSLQPTDVDSWLAAMPPSAVQPNDRAATVRKMLRGIPLPPAFDVKALQRGDIVSDRYQLGAQVTGTVACEWLDRWTAAARDGDGPKLRQARAAMATSRDWPILREMDRQGDYPEEIWDFARDRLGSSGFGRNTAHNYYPGLGCHELTGSRYR